MSSRIIAQIGGILARELPKAGVTEDEDALLTRITNGARTGNALANGTNATAQKYPCKGFISTQRRTKVNATNVDSGDRVVCLLGATLEVKPTTNDQITIDGKTSRIIDIEGSEALWTLLCRA